MLGILGTFYFRTQSRRSEIGLRIALGSSKRKIRSLIFTETLLLLFLASIVATILCMALRFADLIQSCLLYTSRNITRRRSDSGNRNGCFLRT